MIYPFLKPPQGARARADLTHISSSEAAGLTRRGDPPQELTFREEHLRERIPGDEVPCTRSIFSLSLKTHLL